MIDKDPRDWYKKQILHLENNLSRLSNKRRLLAWMRLLSIGTAFILLCLFWSSGLLVALPVFILLLACFLFFVAQDLKNTEKIRHTELLIAINKSEIQVLDHHFTDRPTGDELKPASHAYAHDLDIFGKASLYQYCNRTTSEQGNRVLANWLLYPTDNRTILERQASIQEMAGKMEWRQNLEAYGVENRVLQSTQQRIQNWLQQPNKFQGRNSWKLARILLPVIAFITLGLHIAGIMGASAFYSLVLLYLLISLAISKQVMPQYQQLNKIAREMATLSTSIRHIEQETFQTDLLQSLKSELGGGSHKASVAVKQLQAILDRMDYRLNPLIFLPLNTFLFWDLQQVMSLEKWKTEHAKDSEKWFASLSQMEALSSFGTLYFNNPDWVFPVLRKEDGYFASENLGHPLIPTSKRVTSSFASEGPGQISIITGSNMAGKSTFLRSVGINIVLAMAGAPVCAKRMISSNLKVMSSMRVSDNLEESVSTFYAELKKLKEIIDAVNRKEKVILLLDEILRGTNSADRHTGSSALIRQLIHHDATGLIATHDLGLAKLQDELPTNLHNYHFDVQVANEELYFDYKLKEGVCSSMNASLLMKKIGIEL